MFTLRSIPEALREFWLLCTGSPHSRSRQLAALRKLDGHLLKDIGLTPEDLRGVKVLENLPRATAPLQLGRPYLNR